MHSVKVIDFLLISAKEVFKAMTEPDQKKINDVWGRVDMSGMHSVKVIQKSEDGNAGGKGTIYENYDKKGAMVNKHKIVHYEERDGGKSIYTARAPSMRTMIRKEPWSTSTRSFTTRRGTEASPSTRKGPTSRKVTLFRSKYGIRIKSVVSLRTLPMAAFCVRLSVWD